jgi:hypothetical protein
MRRVVGAVGRVLAWLAVSATIIAVAGSLVVILRAPWG